MANVVPERFEKKRSTAPVGVGSGCDGCSYARCASDSRHEESHLKLVGDRSTLKCRKEEEMLAQVVRGDKMMCTTWSWTLGCVHRLKKGALEVQSEESCHRLGAHAWLRDGNKKAGTWVLLVLKDGYDVKINKMEVTLQILISFEGIHRFETCMGRWEGVIKKYGRAMRTFSLGAKFGAVSAEEWLPIPLTNLG